MMTIKTRHEAGFSLIEMLVVLAISSVIFATIFWTMSFQKMSAQKQTALSDVYENQRFAMDLLSRNIRLAGLNMNSGEFSFLGESAATAGIEPVTPHNDFARGTDKINLTYVLDLEDCPPLPLCEEMPTPSSEFKTCEIPQCWVDMPTPFWTIITDPTGEHSEVAIITHVQEDSMHIQHNPTGCINGYCNDNQGLEYLYPEGSTLSMIAFKQIAYYLTWPSHDSGEIQQSQLVMQENEGAPTPGPVIPLANGVEDLQFAFAIDADGDGLIDDTDGDGIVGPGDYLNGDAVPDNDQIMAVRISMCIRSADWITKQPNSHRPPMEDHDGNFAQEPDGFSRKTISSRVLVRNMAAAYRQQ